MGRKIGLIIGMPFILPWAFLSTLVRGIGRAFSDAWLEVRIDWASAKYVWRGDGWF